jgi:hypothetical protein
MTMSKLIELGDTAFIVLRKQPLRFLHWYEMQIFNVSSSLMLYIVSPRTVHVHVRASQSIVPCSCTLKLIN